MKTLKDYRESNAYYFNDFFIPGDIVGKDVVEEMKNSVPPVTNTSCLIQMGEPYSHIGGKATYMTFVNTSDGWEYRGNCFKGEEYNPFTKWLDKFLEEKGLDLSQEFKQTNESGISITFSYQDIVDQIKHSPEKEQDNGINSIKGMLVRIDMANGDILDYFKHLSKALIPDKKMVEELEDTYGESINLEKKLPKPEEYLNLLGQSIYYTMENIIETRGQSDCFTNKEMLEIAQEISNDDELNDFIDNKILNVLNKILSTEVENEEEGEM